MTTKLLIPILATGLTSQHRVATKIRYRVANKWWPVPLPITIWIHGRYFHGMPHVSGVAALIVSQYGKPGFTNDDLKNRLFHTADPFIAMNPLYNGLMVSAGWMPERPWKLIMLFHRSPLPI
jgi:hypothetical protein